MLDDYCGSKLLYTAVLRFRKSASTICTSSVALKRLNVEVLKEYKHASVPTGGQERGGLRQAGTSVQMFRVRARIESNYGEIALVIVTSLKASLSDRSPAVRS